MRLIKNSYRWILAVILFVILFKKIDFHGTLAIMADFEWLWLIPVVLIIIISYFINSYRWQLLLKCHNQKTDLYRLLKYRVVGEMYGNILPSSMSGEMARAYYLAKTEKIEIDQAFSTVVIEKFSGLIAIITYLLIGLFFNWEIIYRGHIFLWLIIFFMALLLVAVFLFSKKFRFHILSRFRKLDNRIFKSLKRYYFSIHLYRDHIRIFILSIIISFIIQGCTILINYFVALGLGIPLGFFQILLIIPLINASNLIPVSFGNLGFREGIYVFALGAFGVTTTLALALALFMRFIKLIISLFGIFFAFNKNIFNLQNNDKEQISR